MMTKPRNWEGDLLKKSFRKKDGSVRYSHIKVTRQKQYFTHKINGGRDNMYTADHICKMMELLIDNIFVWFGGCLFSSAYCAPIVLHFVSIDLFVYSYENEFLDNMAYLWLYSILTSVLLQKNVKHLLPNVTK